MSDSGGGLTRRRFLEMVGAAGGVAAVHETMTALGWIGRSDAWQGAPEIPAGDGKSVLVLGAGVGGLTAAWQLAKNGFRVTVLEAAARSGGRSYTVRTGDRIVEQAPGCESSEQVCRFADEPEIYLNAGPGRLPFHHRAVLELCRELGVELEIYVMETTANLFQTDGAFGGVAMPNRRVANDTRGYLAEMLAKAVNANFFDAELSAAERVELLGLLRVFGVLDEEYSYTDPARSGYVVEPGVVTPGKAVDKLPFDQLLASGFWNDRFYQPLDYEWQATLFQPVGGMDHVWRAVEQAFTGHGGRVLHGQAAVRIDNGEDGVTVVTEDPATGERSEHRADFCVSNVPLPHLARIIGQDPTFSDDFVAAVSSVTWADTCKVGWQADRRFWEKDDAIYGGISWIDDTITQMWYPSNGYFGHRGVLTGLYNFTSRARRFGNLDLATRLDVAYRAAQRLHPKFADDVPKELGLSIAWQNVPHLNGGWADWQPGQVVEYRRLLRPDNRFWVCGDQVSYLPGWQEGAVLSAHHVVKQLGERAAGRVSATLSTTLDQLETAPETRRLVDGFRLPE